MFLLFLCPFGDAWLLTSKGSVSHGAVHDADVPSSIWFLSLQLGLEAPPYFVVLFLCALSLGKPLVVWVKIWALSGAGLGGMERGPWRVRGQRPFQLSCVVRLFFGFARPFDFRAQKLGGWDHVFNFSFSLAL